MLNELAFFFRHHNSSLNIGWTKSFWIIVLGTSQIIFSKILYCCSRICKLIPKRTHKTSDGGSRGSQTLVRRVSQGASNIAFSFRSFGLILPSYRSTLQKCCGNLFISKQKTASSSNRVSPRLQNKRRGFFGMAFNFCFVFGSEHLMHGRRQWNLNVGENNRLLEAGRGTLRCR